MDIVHGNIHEIYLSVSGEGITTGVPTIFIRIAGCSLRCGITSEGRKLWCDTGYALSPNAGKKLSISEIIDQIGTLNSKVGSQILITGGEPLEGDNRTLVQELISHKKDICLNPFYPNPRIETNGAESVKDLPDAVFTLDYKLPGSGMEDRMDISNFEIINGRKNPLDEIKFVIRDHFDFNRSLEIIDLYKPNCNLLFSPVQSELNPEELADWVKVSNIPRARLSLQIHKYLWGDKRGV
ncbi:7-carboxy-7-deazaguanine synthase QueE [Leptospira sp. GIMC2001]|uniref:7-carboxy-7-deazaguanine synthase QueE n=1 Tax=Leptospira sp. GIMC2001 TaxID=1513297 RepID=UPI00234B7E3D|nr:7-carboxy-7-deazaguanine synthase QueE [Leptospira sp. GIMC2001]WCL51423.1 7-carboxy-7-deazaguanine synthase QueE [Leptospira sp. GIMC2001]